MELAIPNGAEAGGAQSETLLEKKRLGSTSPPPSVDRPSNKLPSDEPASASGNSRDPDSLEQAMTPKATNVAVDTKLRTLVVRMKLPSLLAFAPAHPEVGDDKRFFETFAVQPCPLPRALRDEGGSARPGEGPPVDALTSGHGRSPS